MKHLLLVALVSCATAACSSPSDSLTGPSTIGDGSRESVSPSAPAAPSPALAEPVSTPTIRACGWAELQVPVGDGPPHMRQEFLGRGLVQIHAVNLTANTICEISYTSWEITNPGRNFLINQHYIDGALSLLGPGESTTLGPIRTLDVGCTQQDIANSPTLATRAEQLHAFYYEVTPWRRGACDEPPPPVVVPPPSTPLVDCLTDGVITGGVMKNGIVTFTVNVGPVELSLVAFRFNGATFLPQFWVREDVRTFGVGTHTWTIAPEYQEDLFCGVYPHGVDLTAANYDYWHRRKIAGDFR